MPLVFFLAEGSLSTGPVAQCTGPKPYMLSEWAEERERYIFNGSLLTSLYAVILPARAVALLWSAGKASSAVAISTKSKLFCLCTPEPDEDVVEDRLIRESAAVCVGSWLSFCGCLYVDWAIAEETSELWPAVQEGVLKST